MPAVTTNVVAIEAPVIGQHQDRQGHAGQGRVADEDRRRRAGREAVDAGREDEDQRELPDEQPEEEQLVSDEDLQERR